MQLGQRYMYCSVILGGIFSFISMSDLNNLRKFITTTMYMYLIKKNSGTCIQLCMAQW